MNETAHKTGRPGVLGGERLALLAIAAALILIPIGIQQPGLPSEPRGDEATYRLMIESWRADRDFAVAGGDLPRLFEAFPFAEPSVMLVGDGESLRYAPRALYPLVAAPFSALLGPAGPLTLNGILLAWCLFLGWRHLARRRSSPGEHPGALLVTGTFLLLSPLFGYAFYSQPETLATALVWTSLFLAWSPSLSRQRVPHPDRQQDRSQGRSQGRLRGLWQPFAAGTTAALATSLQPLTLVVALPICARALRSRRAALPLTLVGMTVGLALAAGTDRLGGVPMAWPWTGNESATIQASSSDGMARQPIRFEAVIDNPLVLPAPPATPVEPPSTSFTTALGAVLWGRHTGFFAYFPLALLTLGLAGLRWAGVGSKATGRRQDRGDWLSQSALLAAFGVALVWTAVVLARGQGGNLDPLGNPVSTLLLVPGNRFLAPLYPLFFFLLRRPVPLVPMVVGGAWAAATLGSVLLTPFGMPVANHSAQAHTRGWPLRSLPLELPWLAQLPDYAAEPVVDGTLWMRVDENSSRGGSVATLGGIATELWLETATPIEDVHLSLRDLAIRNHVRLRLGDSDTELDFADVPAGGERRSIHVRPGPPTATRRTATGIHAFYSLKVETSHGARPIWRAQEAGRDYIGIEIAYLGSDAYLRQDVYGLTWLGCGAPSTVTTGATLQVLARVRNTSGTTWPNLGTARVRLAARWYRADGTEARAHGRADLPEPLMTNQVTERWINMEAPAKPGRYTLAIDPVFENVAWFSDHGVTPCRMAIEVIAAEPE